MKYRLREDIDLGHYNPDQPRDSHGRWTSTPGRTITKVVSATPAYLVNGQQFNSGGYALKAAPRSQGSAFMSTFASLKAAPRETKTVDLSGPFDITQARSWYDDAVPGEKDKENLSTDLGLNPAYAKHSISELRAKIKAHETKEDERRALREELHARINLAKAARGEATTFTNRLTRKLEEKPEDADLAPIIGETLAEHPKLGPLAHLWDRMRLAGFKFKKAVTSDEAGDELPRIIARNAVNVIIALLAIHFGVMIPGLAPGGGDG